MNIESTAQDSQTRESSPGEPPMSLNASEVAKQVGLESHLEADPSSSSIQRAAETNPNMEAINKSLIEAQKLIQGRDSNPNFDRDMAAMMHTTGKRLNKLKEEIDNTEERTKTPKPKDFHSAGEAFMQSIEILLMGRHKLKKEEQEKLDKMKDELEEQRQVMLELEEAYQMRERELEWRGKRGNDMSTPELGKSMPGPGRK